MKNILETVNHNDGLKVPEGYFEDFARRMEASLPQREWEREADSDVVDGKPRVLPRSVWQKVRPYVYMAAMFMGVWCMMKTFDMMRPADSLDGNPVVAAAISNEHFVDDYMISAGDVSEYEMLDDLYASGYTPALFTADNNL